MCLCFMSETETQIEMVLRLICRNFSCNGFIILFYLRDANDLVNSLLANRTKFAKIERPVFNNSGKFITIVEENHSW